MNPPVARPLRRFRHELLSFALVSSVPVALALVFPYEALSFRVGGEKRETSPRCAFVTLAAEEERAALAAARASWQVDASGVVGVRADLSTGDLPPEPIRPVIPVRPSARGSADISANYVPNALPSSVGAPAAAQMKAEGEESRAGRMAFSREELLNIDRKEQTR